MSDTGDWLLLNQQQRNDLDAMRKRASDALIAEGEAFFRQHPELKLTWQLTIDALIRREGQDEQRIL